MPSLARSEVSASHELINDHLAMALKMARRLSCRLPESVSREDVESAALLGLTEAAYRYDESRDEPFMAFASKRVRGAILDHLRRIDPMSRRGRQEARRIAEVAQKLETEHGPGVSQDDVAAELGISVDEVQSTLSDARAATAVSMDDVECFVTGMNAETPAECVQRQRMHTALVQALQTLDERSLAVLSLYFLEGQSLREIGEFIGVTESRVCQIRAQALAVLRAQLV